MWIFSQAFLNKFQCGHLTVSPASAAELSLHKFSDIKYVAQSNSTNTAEKSLSITKMQEISSRSQFGTISQRLMDISGTELLTWYKADFRVKKLVPAVHEPASSDIEADYGKKCTELSTKYTRDMSLLKMFATYSCGAWTPSSPTFPKAGFMYNGVCYPLPPSEQDINVTEFGYSANVKKFPTPSTYGVGGSWGKQKFKEIFGFDSRKMNPMWLANIMGFPTDWTHCEVSEMPKYRSVPQWLSLFYING
jgi:hypothetical protein